MSRESAFKHHRFPRDIILCAVRWYLRYPLSYQDVVDLLAERGITVDRSTVYRWVLKFGPELTKRTEKHLRRASVDWHVDETYIRVGGKWRHLWRAVDANGQMIDFRLTARRDAKAAKAFLNKAIERVRLHRPVTIITDKAPTYRRVIREINHRYDPHFDSIKHIDRKWRNNLIESDHAAMKRLLGYRQSFRSLGTAKATLSGIEFRNWRKLKPGIGTEAWFCDPQAPWQKGSVENLNKRARRYLPRDTPVAALSNRSMKAICDRLNGTPRKCLGWRTPAEAFRDELMKLG